MISDSKEAFGSVAIKKTSQLLDSYLKDKGVSVESREAMTNSLEMMYEYIPYTIKQGKNPSDGKVLGIASFSRRHRSIHSFEKSPYVRSLWVRRLFAEGNRRAR